MKKDKRGFVEIVSMLLICLILIFIVMIIFLLYVQINAYVYPIKEDLYYIVQNSFISLNKEELAYSNYVFDESEMFEMVSYALNKNHKEATLVKLKYDKTSNYVDVEIKLQIKPIVLENIINNITLNLKDKVKIKLMEVM